MSNTSDMDNSPPVSGNELDSSVENIPDMIEAKQDNIVYKTDHPKSYVPDYSDYHYNYQIPLPQNGKRCGIIFIDLDGATGPRLLVVKGRDSGIWSFAKGRVKNEFEAEDKCAIREVYEETGIQIRSVQDLPRIVIGRNVYFVLHTSVSLYSSFSIQDKYEVSDVCWKTIEELHTLSANKDVRAVLRHPNRSFPYHRIIFSPPRQRR
jgi:8-oxo-dGTP pyrophosphatase MutT (NUDIX family)